MQQTVFRSGRGVQIAHPNLHSSPQLMAGSLGTPGVVEVEHSFSREPPAEEGVAHCIACGSWPEESREFGRPLRLPSFVLERKVRIGVLALVALRC